jgi:hypothetical protein
MNFLMKIWSWHVENHHKIVIVYTLNNFIYSYDNIIIVNQGKNNNFKLKRTNLFFEEKKIILSMWKLTLGYSTYTQLSIQSTS